MFMFYFLNWMLGTVMFVMSVYLKYFIIYKKNNVFERKGRKRKMIFVYVPASTW